LTGKHIIGTLVADHIHPADVLAYLNKLERTFEKGAEVCTFRLKGSLWIAKMSRISSHRVRIKEIYIDGLGIEDVIKLF